MSTSRHATPAALTTPDGGRGRIEQAGADARSVTRGRSRGWTSPNTGRGERKDAAAVNTLLKAERVSPELVRYDSRTNELITELVRREHRVQHP
jgi:hypothetical protein